MKDGILDCNLPSEYGIDSVQKFLDESLDRPVNQMIASNVFDLIQVQRQDQRAVLFASGIRIREDIEIIWTIFLHLDDSAKPVVTAVQGFQSGDEAAIDAMIVFYLDESRATCRHEKGLYRGFMEKYKIRESGKWR